MSDTMISAKAVVDVIPSGCQYLSEFRCIDDAHRESSKDIPEFWRSWHTGGLFNELFISFNTVVWSCGTEISDSFPKLVLNFNTPVVDAFRSSFFLPALHSAQGFIPRVNENIPGRVQRGLSVFESERMTFIDDWGEHYTVRIPCRIGDVWSLDTLVLLERQPNNSEFISENPNTKPPGSCALFSMFSLTHPLDEAAPVILKVPLSNGGFGIGFVTDIHLKIIGIIPSLNLVLTYHSLTKSHSIWQLEEASSQDYIYLYQVDIDGRVSVAAHALTGLVYQPEFTKHSEKLDGHQTTFDGHSITCTSNSTVCLSPFAASLSRLKKTENQTTQMNYSGSFQSSSHFLISPFTPMNLDAHISRLSNVIPCNNLSYVPSTFNNSGNFYLRRTSIVGSQSIGNTCTPKPIGGIHTSKYNPMNISTLQGRLASTRPNIYPTNQYETQVRTDKFCFIDPDQIKNLLDEPLLPKVCLRLVWSEPTLIQPFNTTVSPGLSSPAKHESNLKKEKILPCIPYASDLLSASGRFALLSRRLPDLPFPTLKAESTYSNSPSMKAKSKAVCSEINISPFTGLQGNNSIHLHHKSGPVKSLAFLAIDLTSVSWICFLIGSPDVDDKLCRLACLRINDEVAGLYNSDCKQSDNNQTMFGSLVHLRACDAVYVPYSLITICLEPGVGIVLYTGIKKLCLLGISPPPLLSLYLAIGGPQILKCRLDHASSDINIPFIVRPSLPEIDRWHQNTVHSILSKCVSTVLSNSMPATMTEWNFNMKTFHFNSLPNDLMNIKELDSKQASNYLYELNSSHIDTKTNSQMLYTPNKHTEVKSLEKISLCDPAGNAFTIVNNNKINNINEERNTLQSNRFLRVYLPAIAENEMVQRCLTSLNQCLSEDVSLLIFTRWYIISNAPGINNPYKFQEETIYKDDFDACYFHGSTEWNRFANFILSTAGLSLSYQYTESVISIENNEIDRGFYTDSNLQRSKRQRPSAENASDLDWINLVNLLQFDYDNKELIQPSLLLPKQVNTSLPMKMSYYDDEYIHYNNEKQTIHLTCVRDDSDSRLILSYLPTILFCFHLTYEEAKLNSVLQDELKQLAELNFILTRILNLPEYTVYYETEYSSLCNLSLIIHINFSSETFQWPIEMSTNIVPCLLTWITKRLEFINSKDTCINFNSYPYLSGVNDLATALAGMIISALSTKKLNILNGKDIKFIIKNLLEFWSNQIFTWKTVKKLNSSVYDYSSKEQENLSIFHDEQVKQWLQTAGPYACAYVETLLTSVGLFNKKISNETEISCLPSSAQHLALLFLSLLESNTTIFHGVLSRRLRVLPSGLSMVLRIFLSRCRLHPPPNCNPDVYSLMGRTDLAKQALMLSDHQNFTVTAQLNSTSNLSNSCFSKPERISLFMQPNAVNTSSSWSVAERWSNLVHPLRDIRSMSLNMAASPHALLYHLESNPCCQVSFKDDLRLREAYRLLQSFSHIRLPRVNSEDPVGSSPSNASGSDVNARLTEARLEMHLAAAGIRVWASVVGRGMLTLGILMGSKVPTQLRVPPICLRGRAISPSSGRRVLVDLARESLGSANVNAGANRTPGTTEVTAPGLDIGGTNGDRRGTTGTQGVDASSHPGNSMALAIASSIASCGAGACLRTASLGLSRMIAGNNLLNHYANSNVSTMATSSAASTASLLSTANIQQAPGVLAAKHWPDFHNGVAIGLSISPHASVDATWIMYNCRAAGLTSTNNRRNNPRTNQDSISSSLDTPSPEQAGLLYGLGLNGHLNKITPYDIGEYLVRVHDLHNMAVLLGLCAGRRGTMDQSILRLIAVHYRPLLPFDPLISVQLSVPNLCQAAAIFGLGLLYQGSAHRHITNLLINELGRSLSEDPFSNGIHTGINSDVDSQQTTSNAPNNHTTNNPVGWTGAGGSGGFAGDSCELMALSAGLALGLVLLQRGDSPCGLSDLHWAEKLHAYMTSGPRSKIPGVSEQQYTVHLPCDLYEKCLPSQRVISRGVTRRLTDQPRHRNQTGVETANVDNNLTDANIRGGASFPLSTFRTPSLLLHSDYTAEPLVDPERFLSNDYLYNTTETRSNCSSTRQISSRGRRASCTTGSSTSPSVTHASGRFPSTVSDLAGRLDDYPTKTTWKNPQIRDLHCYNADVSAPGAMMALGMAYLDSSNPTVSSWFLPPSSLHQLELIRPDLLLFRALAHGLINWNSIEPTQEWIESYVPQKLFEKLGESIRPRPKTQPSDISDIRSTLGQTDLSSEDDVENRCPDQTFVDSLYNASERTTSTRGRRGGLNNVRGRSVRRSRRYGIRQWVEEDNELNQIKPGPGKNEWLNQLGSHSVDPVDIEAISLAYLNMLVGCALAMGLRYAGTSNSDAANTLYYLARSILDDTWWPPSSSTRKSPSQNNSSELEQIKVSLPKSTLVQSAAQCLLALAMILAGSGNLAVLKMVRQLRAIRLFTAKPDTLNSGTNNHTGYDSIYYTVTTAAARAAATTQTASTSSGVASVGGPVSVASVFGAALGPSFGLQLLFANTIGLLFLGGGRLTLANTPEAVAMLVISFFPILPTYAGDNWYHLQALRHLYALATIPRRLCAVDVDTGRVVLSDLQAKLQGSGTILSSKDTFVFPSDVLNKITWLEINHNSEKYWPTVFHQGTNNWDLFKRTFFQAGYIFVKRRDEGEELNVLESWLNECSEQWLDLCMLKQLKLLVAFLKRFPSPNKLTDSNNLIHTEKMVSSSSSLSSAYYDLGRVLAARVTQHFIKHKDELSIGLRSYYFNSPNIEVSISEHNLFQSRLVKAFRLWFSLPDCTVLSHYLPKDDTPSLINFLSIGKQFCFTTPIPNMLWLYRFLYPSDQDSRILST